MMITVHLSDGRKITKDEIKLNWFSPSLGYTVGATDGGDLNCEAFRPLVDEGSITVNLDHVVDMRPAEPDEIEHAKIHGW